MTPDVIDMDRMERDESFERELFALRAEALPEPPLDVAEVFARVRRREGERAARARLVAWIGAASCAAASLLLAVSDAHHVDSQGETMVTNDDAALMCPRVPVSRVPHEVLESIDDTNACVAP